MKQDEEHKVFAELAVAVGKPSQRPRAFERVNSQELIVILLRQSHVLRASCCPVEHGQAH